VIRQIQEETRQRELEIEREDRRDEKIARQQERERKRRLREEALANGEQIDDDLSSESGSEEDDEEEEDDAKTKAVSFAEKPQEFSIPAEKDAAHDPSEVSQAKETPQPEPVSDGEPTASEAEVKIQEVATAPGDATGVSTTTNDDKLVSSSLNDSRVGALAIDVSLAPSKGKDTDELSPDASKKIPFDPDLMVDDPNDDEPSASETESMTYEEERELRTRFVEYGGSLDNLADPEATIKAVYVPLTPVRLIRHVVRSGAHARHAALHARNAKAEQETTQTQEDRKKELLIAQEASKNKRQSLLAAQLEMERQEREQREQLLKQEELQKQALRDARKNRKKKGAAATAGSGAEGSDATKNDEDAASATGPTTAVTFSELDNYSSFSTSEAERQKVAGQRVRRFLVRFYIAQAQQNIERIQREMHPRALFAAKGLYNALPDVARYLIKGKLPAYAEYLWQPYSEFALKQRDALLKQLEAKSQTGSTAPLCAAFKTKLRRAKRDPSEMHLGGAFAAGPEGDDEEEEAAENKENELSATRLSTTAYLMELLREYTPPVLDESSKRVSDPYFERIYQIMLTEYAYEKPQAAPYINYQDPVSKDNILLICASRGLLDIIQLLNECYQGEIDCRVTDRDGCSALYLAAQNGHYGVVRYLTEYMNHPYVTEVPNTKWTPMMIAAARGHWHIVYFFMFEWHDAKYRYWKRYFGERPVRYDTSLDPAPSIYETNRRGETALQVAGNNGYVNIVRMLHEEDLRLRNDIIKRNQYEYMRRKAKIEADAEKAADQLIGRSDDESVDQEARQRFIDEDVGPKLAELDNEMQQKAPNRLLIEMVNEDGMPPLYTALMYGQLFVVEYLLSQDARTDVPLYYIPPGTDMIATETHRKKSKRRSRSRSRSRGSLSSLGETSEISRSGMSEFSRRGSRTGTDFSRGSEFSRFSRVDDEFDDEYSGSDDEYSEGEADEFSAFSSHTEHSTSASASASASAFSRRTSRSSISALSRTGVSRISSDGSRTGRTMGSSTTSSHSGGRRLKVGRKNAIEILAAFAASEKRNNVTAEQIDAALKRGEYLRSLADPDNQGAASMDNEGLDEMLPYPHPKLRQYLYSMMLDNLFDLYIPAAELKRQPLEVLMLLQLYERIRMDWIATTEEDLGKLKQEKVHGMELLYKPATEHLRIRFDEARLKDVLKAPVEPSGVVVGREVKGMIDQALWRLRMINLWRLSNMVTMRQAEAQRNLRICNAFKVPLSQNSHEVILKRCAIVRMIDPENTEWEDMEYKAKLMRQETLNQ